MRGVPWGSVLSLGAAPALLFDGEGLGFAGRSL